MNSLIKGICLTAAALLLNACATMNNDSAAPERYSDLHFDNKAPIPLTVKTINVRSEFTPTFTRPNVEHLLPTSIEKTAKTWANERLQAAEPSSSRTAEFVIKDASVVEHEERSNQILQKDRLKYRANLNVVLRVIDHNASAQTSVEAFRELTMPIDTSIEDKEKHWNEMVINLFRAFDQHMEINAQKSLNMYIKNNNTVTTY